METCDRCSRACDEPPLRVQVSGGRTIASARICSSCREASGWLAFDEDWALDDLLESVMEIEDSSCPDCGWTLSQLNATHRVGCPSCYTVFAEDIDYLRERKYQAIEYRGELPAALAAIRKAAWLGPQLERKLSKLLEAEDYEGAAALQRELDALDGASGGTK